MCLGYVKISNFHGCKTESLQVESKTNKNMVFVASKSLKDFDSNKIIDFDNL